MQDARLGNGANMRMPNNFPISMRAALIALRACSWSSDPEKVAVLAVTARQEATNLLYQSNEGHQ